MNNLGSLPTLQNYTILFLCTYVRKTSKDSDGVILEYVLA